MKMSKRKWEMKDNKAKGEEEEEEEEIKIEVSVLKRD